MSPREDPPDRVDLTSRFTDNASEETTLRIVALNLLSILFSSFFFLQEAGFLGALHTAIPQETWIIIVARV